MVNSAERKILGQNKRSQTGAANNNALRRSLMFVPAPRDGHSHSLSRSVLYPHLGGEAPRSVNAPVVVRNELWNSLFTFGSRASPRWGMRLLSTPRRRIQQEECFDRRYFLGQGSSSGGVPILVIPRAKGVFLSGGYPPLLLPSPPQRGRERIFLRGSARGDRVRRVRCPPPPHTHFASNGAQMKIVFFPQPCDTFRSPHQTPFNPWTNTCIFCCKSWGKNRDDAEGAR